VQIKEFKNAKSLSRMTEFQGIQGKGFSQKYDLTKHERIHSKNKCYRCKWTGCDYTASDRTSIVGHIRGRHFGLPRYKKDQEAKGVVDNRDPRDYFEKI